MPNIGIAKELQPPFELHKNEKWLFNLTSGKHYRISQSHICEYGENGQLLAELRSELLPDPKKSIARFCHDGSYIFIRGNWTTERSLIFSLRHRTSVHLPTNGLVVGDKLLINLPQVRDKAKEAKVYDLRTGEYLYHVNVSFPICYIHNNYLISSRGVYEVVGTGKKRKTQLLPRNNWRSMVNFGAAYGRFAHVPLGSEYYQYVSLETLKITQGPKYEPPPDRSDEELGEEDPDLEQDRVHMSIPTEGIHILAKQCYDTLFITVYSRELEELCSNGSCLFAICVQVTMMMLMIASMSSLSLLFMEILY